MNRPPCSNLYCGHLADSFMHIHGFGAVYYCAKHILKHLKEELCDA